MEDLEAMQNYIKKIQRAINNADLSVFQYRFVKKNRIDDLLVCTLAVMPEVFKVAMSRRQGLEMYPSVSSYSRLSKVIKRTFFLMSDYYMVDYAEASKMLVAIQKFLSKDIKRLEDGQ